MTSEQYKAYLSDRLIKEFQEKYYEKIGITPMVSVRLDGIKRLTMYDMETLLNEEIPCHLRPYYKTIRSNTRIREIVSLRQIFSHILHKEYKYGPTAICTYLKQDHTTVIHSIRTVNNLLSTETHYKEEYNRLLNKVRHNGTNPIQQTQGSGNNPEPVYDTVAYEKQPVL